MKTDENIVLLIVAGLIAVSILFDFVSEKMKYKRGYEDFYEVGVDAARDDMWYLAEENGIDDGCDARYSRLGFKSNQNLEVEKTSYNDLYGPDFSKGYNEGSRDGFSDGYDDTFEMQEYFENYNEGYELGYGDC